MMSILPEIQFDREKNCLVISCSACSIDFNAMDILNREFSKF